jgi:hypothetical protein
MNYNTGIIILQNDLVYVIIDFKEPTDSPDFMHVLIKPLMVDYCCCSDGDDVLFNMANSGEEEPNSIIQHYFDFDFAKDL